MNRSKENLLSSFEDIESQYRTRLKGIRNQSFDYTTESSRNSPKSGQGKPTTIELVQVHKEATQKPKPLPRSRIPRLRSREKEKETGKENLQVKQRNQHPEDSPIEPESTEASVPLTTFVVNERGRAKKSKQRRKEDNNHTEESSVTVPSTDDLSSSSSNGDKRDDQQGTEKIKRRRRKKTNLGRSHSHESEDAADSSSVIGIYVHDLEFLKFSPELESVHVRVSFYDQSTGQLLGRLRGKSGGGDIQPVITKRCRFENVNYLHCVWDELLLVQENVLVLRNENSIVFFEIIVTVESSIDFQTVAWAFLRPFHADKYDNIDQRLRLQVFHFNAKMSLFQNWRNAKRYKKYPSTLWITLKSVTPLTSSQVADKEVEEGEKEKADVPENPFDVSALARSRTFKRPNQVVSALKLPGKGTNLLKISPGGDLVAIANPQDEGNASEIVICTLPELRVVQHLEGHSKLIYGLEWKGSGSGFPQTLISCSADRTAIVWTIDRHFNYSLKVLPHVTFIYCCSFWTHHLRDFVLTAGKDSILRVWTPANGSFKIHQELAKGTGFVTCLVVASDSSSVFTGNSEGRVFEWNWSGESFAFSRTIYEDKSVIGHLELHPRIGNLFVGTHRTEIVSVNLESRIVVQRFPSKSHEPRKISKFRISGCGTYLLAVDGGHDVHCWNILTQSEESSLDFVPRTPGLFSCVEMPRKGSFAILGKYQTNKNAVLLINNSSSSVPGKREATADGPSDRPGVSTTLHDTRGEENREATTAVKNKLSEIIEKLDQVFVLPRLCDDEKISLTQDMVDEKRRIEEWLDRNVTPRGALEEKEPSGEDGDDGTFTVQRQESVKSNGTFTVEREAQEVEEEVSRKPKRKTLTKNAKQEEHPGDKSEASGGTYEVKKKRDTDADDTSVSDSVFA